MEEVAFLDALEFQLIEGGGRWVADFSEAVRQVRIRDQEFDLVVKGSPRGRTGYFLSAFAARIALPDYDVACLAKISADGWDAQGVQRAVDLVRRARDQFDLRWVWLVLVQTRPLIRGATREVEGFDEKEIGMVLVNLNNMEAAHSANLLGWHLARLIKPGRRRAVSRGAVVEPGSRSRVQVSRLALLFGGFLILLMILTGLGQVLLGGIFFIPIQLFLANLGVAAALAYGAYLWRHHLGLKFDGEGFQVVRGAQRPVQGRWGDYDMVSLFHLGGGRYHVTLYRRGDHSKFAELPASELGLDPSGFRRKAMELTGHGRGTPPPL